MGDAPHHLGSFKGRSSRLRARANADPGCLCWRCGLTLAEVRRRNPGKAVVWHAGHTIDSDSSAPLAAECSVCNLRAGARRGNASRMLNPSRRWY